MPLTEVDVSQLAQSTEVPPPAADDTRRPPWVRWSAAAVGIVVPAMSYAQWKVMPGMPRFVAPVLALAGAAIVTWVFVDTVSRSLRRYRSRRPLPIGSLATSAALLILLVVLPLMRLPAALSAPQPGAPRVLSGFRDWLGSEGYPRIDGLHRGVDVAAPLGAAVLASADGRVVLASDNGGSCGLMIVIVHDDAGHRTIYCHLSATSARVGDQVQRGDPIGAVGISGMRPWPGYEHVHWMLQAGRNGPWLDPIARTVGCFDRGRAYATDRLVLTYPVRC